MPPDVPREPHEVLVGLAEMGRSVRTARMRRRLTARDFASRIGISLPTLRRLEAGDPGVSWGIVATACWVLGLFAPLRDAVRPEADAVAAHIEAARLPRRIRRSKEDDLADL